MFSITNKIDNKHIRPIASSRKPLRVLSSFGGADTFSQTWTSFLPVIFVPDRPMKTSGTPFLSTVCGFGQMRQYVNTLRTATDWTQSLIPISILSITSPVRLLKIYTWPWSLPVIMALFPSWKATERSLLVVNGTSKVFNRSVVENLKTATPCETSSMIKASSFTLMAAWPLVTIKVSKDSKTPLTTHITVPVSFDFKTFPLSLSTCLGSL